MKNSVFLKGILYIILCILGFLFKINYFNFVFLFISFFLDFVFLINLKYIENISFSFSNKFIKKIKNFLKLVSLEFDAVFIFLYLDGFFKFFKIFYYLIFFTIIILTITIFTIFLILNISNEKLIFRLAKEFEKEDILKIYIDGSNQLKKDSVDQWQGKYYPSMKDILNHLKKDLFVLEYQKNIVATACLQDGIDMDYEKIFGKWNTKKEYISIHKFATKEEYKNQGFAKKIMYFIEIYAKKNNKDLRIDTHEDNKKMKKFIFSCSFNYCGVVYLNGELKRVAFDKKITK